MTAPAFPSPDKMSSWQIFLNLGEKINVQPTITGQREIIRSTISTQLDCDVTVWLSKQIYQIPGNRNLDQFSKQPETNLSQEAAESRTACYEDENGEIHTWGTDPVIKCRAIALPMITQGIVTGVLEARRKPGHEFNPEELDFLMGAAAHIAMALYMAHRNFINSWRLEQLGLIRSVSEQIANIHHLDELCRKVTEAIIHTFHFYAVSIYTLETGRNKLTFRSTSIRRDNGKVETLDSPIFEVFVDRGIIGTVARCGSEILANDVSKDSRFVPIEALPLTRAEVTLPLKIDDQVVGILDIQSSEADVFHAYDMLVLRSLADTIALAVQGARLYSSLQRRIEQIETVAEVGRVVSSILDTSQLMVQLVDLIRNRFGYSFVHLFLVQKEKGTLVYRAGSGEKSKVLQKQGLSFRIDDEAGIIPWVARTGKTWVANDIHQDPHYRPSELPPVVTQSEMAVPIVFGEELLGVLDVQSDEPFAFDEDDEFVFEALADTVAVAIRNATLYQSERWRRQIADSLREVAGLLSANVATSQILDAILTELEKILPCKASAIWLLDPSGTGGAQTLTLAAAHGMKPEMILEAQKTKPEVASWIQEAIQLKEPNIRKPADPYGPLGAAGQYQRDYSSIAAPLHLGEVPLGLLTLAHPEPNRYGPESRLMTSTFASYAAVSIQNARLYEKAQEQAWISSVLLQVAEATQSLTNLDDLAAAITKLTPMLAGVKGCGLYLWDEQKQNYRLLDEYGLHPSLIENHIELSEAFSSQVKSEQPAFLPDQIFELWAGSNDHSSPHPLPGSLFLIPMAAHENVKGVFLVEYAEEGVPLQFNGRVIQAEEKISILKGIAHQALLAIENLQLLEEQQMDAYVSAALLQVAQMIVSFTDLDDILGSIPILARILAGAESCLIFLRDEEKQGFQIASSAGLPRQIVAELNQIIHPQVFSNLVGISGQRDGPAIFRLTSLQKDLRRLGDFSELDRIRQPQDFQEKENLLILLPLHVQGEVYGYLLATDPGSHIQSVDKRIELLEGISRQTALAIMNDRYQKEMVSREALEHEFQLAREIQQTFLPSKIPQIDGWDLDARWRPARKVGGDFYDLFYLPGQALGVTIADISDKGVSAALYMTLTRTLMRAVIQETRNASETLERVNDLLLSETPHGVFVTALIGILNPRTGEFKYANAGHNLPILKSEDNGEISFLEKGEMALGVLPHIKYREHRLAIQPGEILIFYTDGIPDTLDRNGNDFGMDRFLKTIREAKDFRATEMLDAIDRNLMNFAGSQTPTDDVTVVGIKRLKPG